MNINDLTDHLAAAARDLGSQDVEDTLHKSVGLAVDLIDGCDAAGVTLVHRGQRLDTPAYTSNEVLRGDQLQYELQEGPCMDAVWDHEIVISPDLKNESRWPTWAPTVVTELGARSMMCIQLFADDTSLGALNMYATTVDAFSGDDTRHEGLALAAHIAVALAAAQKIEQLHLGMDRRTIIGQAQGILMERFDITADRAFTVLQRVSSTSNTKLHQVAVDLVTSRKIPTPRTSEH
jgi:GAF domain-containing protein